jgi:anti-anti-sigma factor
VNTQNQGDTTPVSSISVTHKWVERTAVVAVSGDLDMLTAPELSDAIQATARRMPAVLIVDLSEVDFLASAGINVLITAQEELEPSVRFGVVADGPATSRPLRLIGVDIVVALYRTLDEALSNLAS